MTLDGKIPITRNPVSAARAERIRDAVRNAEAISTEAHHSCLADIPDASMFYEFLSDPEVHAPIYSLPTDLNETTVAAFIREKRDEREAGDGLLFLNFDRHGQIAGYIDIQIWPHWAAGELGGAVHPNRQGAGRGMDGARLSFNWMFEVLDLDLICETAAPDNIRTIRLLDGLGFKRKGEVTSRRDDGSTRASLVWEIARAEWAVAINKG